MSLINDALKRASQAQQTNPPPNFPPLPPVESKSGGAVGWMLPAVMVFLIVAACFFIGLSMARHTVTQTAREASVPAMQKVESVSVPVSNAPSVPETSVPAASTPPSPSPPPLPPPPPLPLPKLQGIVYSPARPWAIVNGRTVHAGDRLGEFRVREISQYTVTLERADGSQVKLELDK